MFSIPAPFLTGISRRCQAPAVFIGLACVLAACGDNLHLEQPDAEPPSPAALQIEPLDAMVAVVNGAAVEQAYTATLIESDGGQRDVTSDTTFALADARYGSVEGATVTVTGEGAGPTRVIASYGDFTVDVPLTVFVEQLIVDPDVAPDAPQLFESAAEDDTLAPTVAYPFEGNLLPPNLGEFDVHWRQASADLFEIRLANTYIDIKRYTNGDDPAQPFWTVFSPAQWHPIASAQEQLALEISGMSTADTSKKGRSDTRRVDVTNEDAVGAIYYWSTSGLAGIWRYDLGGPDHPPAPYFADAQRPAGCMGCHALSRDGSKIAMTFDGGHGRGTVFDVASRAPLIPFDGVSQPALHWDFATFNAQATKLVTVEDSQLYLRAIDGTLLAGPLPSATGGLATHADISPDNDRLVSVEFTGGYAAVASEGSLVIRSYDDATNTFGDPTVLVPASAGASNFYPAFSPDGQWIAFTRTPVQSYDDPQAQTWVIKADGSQPPVELTLANKDMNLTNSWARWMPSEMTFGPQSDKLFYLTFSSKRDFGVRIPFVGRPQIWVTPFHIDKAENGQDPSGPAFRLPFQNVLTANHIAQWTEAVVGE